jgi:hypothetical protein
MIVAYVPHSMVKDMLAQHDCLGVRGNGWWKYNTMTCKSGQLS